MRDKIFQKKNPFLNSVMLMASGTAVAQAVSFLASPIITRIYTPEDMGALASYLAIVTIIGTIAAGSYEHAVVLPKRIVECNAVVYLGFAISLGIGIFITITTILFKENIILALKLSAIPSVWIYLLGLFISFIGFDQVLLKYSIRNRKFKNISYAQVIHQSVSNGIKILYGFLSRGVFGLLLSAFLGQLVRFLLLFFVQMKDLFIKENVPKYAEVKAVMIKYKKFPLISTWSNIMNATSVQLPVILFSVFFSIDVAGWFSLSHRMISLPVNLLGQSVGNVFLERASKSKDDNFKLAELTNSITRKMFIIGSIGMSIIMIFGDAIFSFIFGQNWIEAGKYSQWIAIWLLFVFASSPLSSIFSILERQLEYLIINTLMLVSRVLSLFICYKLKVPAITTVAIFSLTGAFIWIVFSFRVLILSGVGLYKSIKSIIFIPVLIITLMFMFKWILWRFI